MMQEHTKINLTELEANQNIAARNYWKNRLTGFEPTVYFDFADAWDAPGQGRREFNFELPQPVVKWLQEVAASDHAKHVLLMASMAILINKYSGVSDTVVFTPPYLTEGTDGSSLQLVPVRMRDFNNKRFKDALLQLKTDIVQDIAFGNYPTEKKLAYINESGNKNPAIGLALESIQDIRVFDVFTPELLFIFSGTNGFKIRAAAKFHYTYLYQLKDAYYRILETIAQDPLVNIGSISIFSKADMHASLYEFNGTQTGYPNDKTIPELFEAQVAKTPDSVAVLFGTASVSYRQLLQQCDKVALYLKKEQGVKKGDVVAILLDRQLLLPAVILGVLKAGAAYVPIDPQYPPARIQSIISDSGVKVIITTVALQQQNIFNGSAIAGIDEIEQYIIKQPAETIATAATPDDLAYIIYTSGSTGKPKGVMIEHRSLVNYIHWAAKYYVREDADIFALYTSISFDLTVTSIYAPLITGNSICIYAEQDKELLVEKVFTDNIATVIKLTPSHLKIIREHPAVKADLSHRKKKLIVGGEDLESQLAKDIYNKFNGNIEIYNEYGPTEATVGCMIYRFQPEDTVTSVPIGNSIANSRLYIFNKHLQIVPVGVWGELYIAGDGLARGYINNDELTRERFIDNPYISGERIYKTGDVARRPGNGIVQYAGRLDEQVKIRGFRIELGEIEHRLNAHPMIKESVVITTNKEDRKVLVAYYVSHDSIQANELRNFLLECIPDFMTPSFYVHLKQLPLNINGKVDRRALPGLMSAPPAIVRPSDEIEEKLASLWAEVLDLNKDEIGANINFFELGGDSIAILKLNNKINTQFQSNIPVTDMFMLPTITAIRNRLKNGGSCISQPDIIAAQEDRESILINRG
jgi:fengycin family lipopeptide synthetase D